ncbi:MAG: DUF1847 domain-containing protein, partial [Candidatus Bathyarchaeia archaeon]
MSRLDCAACGVNLCGNGGRNESFDGCPMNTSEGILLKASRLYEDTEELREMARAAAIVEATGYMKWTRIEDTMEFARLMGFKKLGIACCAGLRREGAVLENILKKNDFEVVSAICKTGAVPKEKLGLADNQKVHPGQFEAMCNPVAQAMLLDSAGSQLNILVGLCVGHDSIFMKTSKAPVTVLVAKDRVLCHNPVAAIYNHQAYYRK